MMDDELANIAAAVQLDIDGMTVPQRRKWMRQFKRAKGVNVGTKDTLKWIALSQQWSAAKAAVDLVAALQDGRVHAVSRTTGAQYPSSVFRPPHSG